MSEFFEGREKTLRVNFTMPLNKSLLDLSKELWSELLKQTGCTIIGELYQNEVTAYMLSESSLFVWKDHIILKTCGTTAPLQILPLLHRQVEWLQGIARFSYTNGAFLRPQLQPPGYRSEKEVVLQINNTLLGIGSSTTDCLGSSVLLPDGSLECIFKQPAIKSSALPIVEIKFSKLQECGRFFSADDIKSKEEMFSGLFKEPWKTDHFHFEPCGFSLNALRPEMKEVYATIHVTPEPEFSYVSFETNYLDDLENQMKKLCSLFCPKEAVITVSVQYPDTSSCAQEKSKTCNNTRYLEDCFHGLDVELHRFKDCYVENHKFVFYMVNFIPT